MTQENEGGRLGRWRDRVGGAIDRAKDVKDIVDGGFGGLRDRAITRAIGKLPDDAINLGEMPSLSTAIQTGLNALGFDAGTPDGMPGPGTLGALNEFLESKGMEALESIADFAPEHMAALYTELKSEDLLKSDMFLNADGHNLKDQIVGALLEEVPGFSEMKGIGDRLQSLRDRFGMSADPEAPEPIAVAQDNTFNPTTPGGMG